MRLEGDAAALKTRPLHFRQTMMCVDKAQARGDRRRVLRSPTCAVAASELRRVRRRRCLPLRDIEPRMGRAQKTTRKIMRTGENRVHTHTHTNCPTREKTETHTPGVVPSFGPEISISCLGYCLLMSLNLQWCLPSAVSLGTNTGAPSPCSCPS